MAENDQGTGAIVMIRTYRPSTFSWIDLFNRIILRRLAKNDRVHYIFEDFFFGGGGRGTPTSDMCSQHNLKPL